MIYITRVTLILIGVLILKRIIKNNISPSLNIFLWTIVLVGMIIPNLPESNISIHQIYNNNEISTFEDNINFVRVEKKYNFKTSYVNEGMDEHNDNSKNNDKYFREKDSVQNEQKRIYNINTVSYGISLLVFMYFISTYFILNFKIRNIKTTTNEDILKVFKNLREKLSIKGKIKIIEVGSTPMIIGIINPVISVPRGYSEKEYENMLVHELMHYKYKDNILLWIGIITLAMFWYNPIFWYAFSVYRKDIEMLCDYRSLQILKDRKDYANLLIKVAMSNRFATGIVCMGNGEKEVEARIKKIAMYKKPSVYVIAITLLLIGIVSIILLTSPKRNDAGKKSDDKDMIMLVESALDKISSTKDNPMLAVQSNTYTYIENNLENYNEIVNLGIENIEVLIDILASKEEGLESEVLFIAIKDIVGLNDLECNKKEFVDFYAKYIKEAIAVYQLKNEYIGDNSKSGHIMYDTTMPDGYVPVDGFELHTNDVPYGATIKYKENVQADRVMLMRNLRRNAQVFLGLISNADFIEYEIEFLDGTTEKFRYELGDFEENLKEKSSNLKNFIELYIRTSQNLDVAELYNSNISIELYKDGKVITSNDISEILNYTADKVLKKFINYYKFNNVKFDVIEVQDEKINENEYKISIKTNMNTSAVRVPLVGEDSDYIMGLRKVDKLEENNDSSVVDNRKVDELYGEELENNYTYRVTADILNGKATNIKIYDVIEVKPGQYEEELLYN